MNDGLTERQRRVIVSALAAQPRIRRAVLFGSRALGTWQPASDIDLALSGDHLTLSDLAKILSLTAELNLPVELDLLIYEQITNENLRRHIDEKGVGFFSR